MLTLRVVFKEIAALAAACMEALGAPVGMLTATWKRQNDSGSRIRHLPK